VRGAPRVVAGWDKVEPVPSGRRVVPHAPHGRRGGRPGAGTAGPTATALGTNGILSATVPACFADRT